MDAIFDFLTAPAWPILAWCGLAASLLAAFVLPARAANRSGVRARPRWIAAVVLGLFVFAPLYGLAFEALGRADIGAGAILGTAHGFASAVRAIPQRNRVGSVHLLRLFAAGFVFGTVLGYLYPIPAA